MDYAQIRRDTRSFFRKSANRRSLRLAFLGALSAALCVIAAGPDTGAIAQEQAPSTEAAAETASPEPSQEATPIGVELNKLETIDTGCRIYVVVDNKSDTEFKTLKLDLVLFRTDGIVDQRFFVDLAPLRKQKRIVKLFELSKVACDDIGSFLVNDVVECRSETESIDNCLARLSVSSLTKAKLSK